MFRIGARNCERILALLLTGDTGTDFKHWKRSQKRHHTRNRIQFAHHLACYHVDRLTFFWRLNKSEGYSLVSGEKSRGTSHGEVGNYIGIAVEHFIHVVLDCL